MAGKRFEVLLTPEDRYEVEIVTDRGQVTQFTIRYDAYLQGAWHAIVIFDNHGGHAHQHLMDPITGKGEPRTIPLDLKEAVTYAIYKIQAMWEDWREQYKRRLQGGEPDLL